MSFLKSNLSVGWTGEPNEYTLLWNCSEIGKKAINASSTEFVFIYFPTTFHIFHTDFCHNRYTTALNFFELNYYSLNVLISEENLLFDITAACKILLPIKIKSIMHLKYSIVSSSYTLLTYLNFIIPITTSIQSDEEVMLKAQIH